MHPSTLLAVLVLLTASVMGDTHIPQYFNEWVVEVNGGEETAKRVAKELGYNYEGPIEQFDDFYIYTRDDHPSLDVKGAHHHTDALMDRDEVVWAKQQVTVARSLRDL